MMVSEARVPLGAQVNWTILKMAMQMESEILRPQLTDLTSAFQRLHDDLAKMTQTLDMLVQEALTLKADTTPLWEDVYTLCGNSNCDGGCRVCQEGEKDYEDDTEEKYCRRRRR